MDEALEEAQRDIHKEIEERQRRETARRAHLVAKATFTTRSINPFDILQLEPPRARGGDNGKSLTEKQRLVLLRQGVNPDQLPLGQARQLINEIFRRFDRNLASLKQCKILRARGFTPKKSRGRSFKTHRRIAIREGGNREISMNGNGIG